MENFEFLNFLKKWKIYIYIYNIYYYINLWFDLDWLVGWFGLVLRVNYGVFFNFLHVSNGCVIYLFLLIQYYAYIYACQYVIWVDLVVLAGLIFGWVGFLVDLSSIELIGSELDLWWVWVGHVQSGLLHLVGWLVWLVVFMGTWICWMIYLGNMCCHFFWWNMLFWAIV